jgi:hypothetical protein
MWPSSLLLACARRGVPGALKASRKWLRETVPPGRDTVARARRKPAYPAHRPGPSRAVAFLPALLGAAALFCASPAAEAAGATVVLKAEAGQFLAHGSGAPTFVPSTVVPLKDGQFYGWRIVLKTSKNVVQVDETLTLPQEPRTWGDPDPLVKRKTSADGRTATSQLHLRPEDGVIYQNWAISTGDPRGQYVFRVSVEGGPEHVFKLDVR